MDLLVQRHLAGDLPFLVGLAAKLRDLRLQLAAVLQGGVPCRCLLARQAGLEVARFLGDVQRARCVQPALLEREEVGLGLPGQRHGHVEVLPTAGVRQQDGKHGAVQHRLVRFILRSADVREGQADA